MGEMFCRGGLTGLVKNMTPQVDVLFFFFAPRTVSFFASASQCSASTEHHISVSRERWIYLNDFCLNFQPSNIVMRG